MPPLTRGQKFFLLVTASAAALDDDEESKRPRRKPNQHRDRTRAMNDVFALSDKDFKARFRMSRPTFARLLDDIRPDLEKCDEMAIRSSKEPVYPYLRLCIGIRYLAGGSYLDIADVYGVCRHRNHHNVSDCCTGTRDDSDARGLGSD
jgi:hypothetical protein